MSTGKVVLGTLAGLAVGGILGILFAPEKGSKTRKMILDKGEGYADDLKNKFNDMFDKASNKYNGALKEVKDYADKVEL